MPAGRWRRLKASFVASSAVDFSLRYASNPATVQRQTKGNMFQRRFPKRKHTPCFQEKNTLRGLLTVRIVDFQCQSLLFDLQPVSRSPKSLDLFPDVGQIFSRACLCVHFFRGNAPLKSGGLGVSFFTKKDTAPLRVSTKVANPHSPSEALLVGVQLNLIAEPFVAFSKARLAAE